MSGIGGILNLDGRAVALEDLERVREAIAHRGPDRQGTWNSGCVGLVHVYLETEPQVEQPLRNGGNCLVLDGRIDNIPFLEKRSRGSAQPALVSEQGFPSAPEVVLGLCERRGEKALPLLLGDFALALWEGAGERLLLARDPMGAKPLFYFQDGCRLIFASEAKGILAVPGVPRERDRACIEESNLLENMRSVERTCFGGVRRLLPGELLCAQGGAVRKRTFWSPNPKRRILLAGREAYRRRFRELFLEAVRCRLPKKGPVAIRLSGGLDSSAVAGACAHIQKTERPDLRLIPISIFSDLLTDERPYAKAVCAAYGLRGFSFLAESVNLLDGIEQAAYCLERPIFNPDHSWVLRQHKIAAEQGVRVSLDGEYGDQVMNSSAHLADVIRAGQWRKFWREFRLTVKHNDGSPLQRLQYLSLCLLLPSRGRDRFERARVLLVKALLRLLPFKIPIPFLLQGPKFPSCVQREFFSDIFGPYRALQRETFDLRAAQCGIESRSPFLDRRLVVFAMSVPWEENVRDGQGRRLEREALDDILPGSIAQRKGKWDFSELERLCLGRAGFQAANIQTAMRHWDRRTRHEWTKRWLG